MTLRRVSSLLIPLVVFGLPGPRAEAAPKLVSIYPLGGQRGTALDVEIHGTGLEGSYAVWLGAGCQTDSLKSASASPANIKHNKSPGGLEAQIKSVADGSRATIHLAIDKAARVGFHTLSLISPSGLSGAISFWVGPDAVIQETGAPHNTPDTAQPVKQPVAINGRISENGELDYYVFEIAGEQTVAFEVIALHGADFDPQLALYEAGGSYLDPQRSKRLLFHEEITQGGMPASRRMTYHFTKSGRYLVNLGNVFARGAANSTYLLRIAPAAQETRANDAVSWGRRRLDELRLRTVGAPAMDVDIVKQAQQARFFKVPAIVEGTIGHPGDIDHFRFKAKAGQKLVFEVQTPGAGPPHFNPRLDILDAKGDVLLTNLQAQEGKIGTEAAKVMHLDSRIIGKLDREGEYVLRIRDLTSIHGSPDHVYRVLIRPQIPHVGDIGVQPSGPVNLIPGAKQRLTLSMPPQEGFEGTLAISIEGLPAGVRAFVGASNSMIELIADANAPFTGMPQMFRISGLPLVAGKTGSAFPAAEIPLMVLKK